MRILHVHSGNLFGGVETMMLAMVRHRHLCPELESTFALCFKNRLAGELMMSGAEIHDLGEVKIRRVDSVWRARRHLADLLRAESFDMAMTHSAWSQTVFGSVIRQTGLPLVNYLHGAATGHHWLERLARRTPPDLVLANSRFTASTAKNIYPNTPCEIVYPLFAPVHSISITGEERARIRAEMQTDENAPVIIQVSRMETGKGHALHLQALSRLSHLPGWVCWMVGGALRPEEIPYQDELKKLAADLGIADRVHFLGERMDVPQLLAAADIFCQPNVSPDSFGLVFVEALAAGLPVVTTAMGGALEIVDDSCGYLTLPGDPESLALALHRLIEHPELRRQLGDNGLVRAQGISDVKKQLMRLEFICGKVNQSVAA